MTGSALDGYLILNSFELTPSFLSLYHPGLVTPARTLSVYRTFRRDKFADLVDVGQACGETFDDTGFMSTALTEAVMAHNLIP